MYGTARATGYGCSLYEIEAYAHRTLVGSDFGSAS
jgi:hypothetical protein